MALPASLPEKRRKKKKEKETENWDSADDGYFIVSGEVPEEPVVSKKTGASQSQFCTHEWPAAAKHPSS
jgi:hypothetical protein